tara:strand:+ start:712 stop:1608 length:897 start_codon:yes stop_codon:yes gene_type:complete
MMRRRKFIKAASVSGLAITKPSLIISPSGRDQMDRIGLTTVVFRNRFSSTAPKNVPLKDELKLTEVPEYFADRFKVRNVELWSQHFESQDDWYLAEIAKSLKKSRSNLIDIQVDTKHDLSDPDETNRQLAISENMAWVDIAKRLNSQFVRISPMKKSYAQAISSLKVLVDYCKKSGVVPLLENHNDLFSNVDHHLSAVKDINDSKFGLLADFGNYPGHVDQVNALTQIAPFTELISAKTKAFDEQMRHVSYDFGKCVSIFEKSGYKGIYSLEQWGPNDPTYDYEKITDWMINSVLERI